MEAGPEGMRVEPSGRGAGHKKVDEGGVCLKLRINELEKDKLLLASNHNQEVCALRAELTALRAGLERSEAQRAELLYQLTVAAAEKHLLSGRADQDQQEVKDRDRLLQRLRRRLKVMQQQMKTLQSTLEAERVTHQVRRRSLEAALQEAEFCVQRLRSVSTEKEEELRAEQERRSLSERALHRLQSELGVALETTSDLSDQLEEERRRHVRTHTQIQQMISDSDSAAKPDGKCSPDTLELLGWTLSSAHLRLEVANQQLIKLEQQNSDREGQRQEAERKLEEAAAKLRQATMETQGLLGEREREREKWASERKRERKEWVGEREKWASERKREREEAVGEREKWASEREREREEWVGEREKWASEREREKEEREKWASERNRENKEWTSERERERDDWARDRARMEAESSTRLLFLSSLSQRVGAGRVPPHRSHAVTWQQLCDVITEQVDQLTSDLSSAQEKVDRLLRVCEQRSVCVRRLQHSHNKLLSQLKLRRGQCDSLTSELSESRGEAASLLTACTLLAGALSHAHRRLLRLRQMKTLLWRQLQEGAELEQEVRRLADALGGKGAEPGRVPVSERWRRSLWAVLAVTRWRLLVKNNNVTFWFPGVGGVMGVCGFGEEAEPGTGVIELSSAHLHSTLLSSMSDLHLTGSAHIVPAARRALSRLLELVLDQSELPADAAGEPASSQPNMKAVVSDLQQHFLLFSQRLLSTEIEGRSLRLELANQSRAAQKEKRSLRIVGKHLLKVDGNRKQLRKQLEDEQRRRNDIIRWMKAAETSCHLVRESLSQSQRCVRVEPLPLLSMMGAPEKEACQSFWLAVCQLRHVCCSTIGRLQQQVSAHSCLHDNRVNVHRAPPFLEKPLLFPE